MNPESYSWFQLFEYIFMKDYLKNVILRIINNNTEGPRVTYGEGIWLLMGTVIGPSRDGFFSTRPVDEITAAPFRVVKLMIKRCFERILGAIWYNKTKAPSYNDRFRPVRKMIVEWNANMEKSFGLGWVSCLDESMSPWTKKYTCPGHMCVPHKPWPVGNKYHSIYCCMSVLLCCMR